MNIENIYFYAEKNGIIHFSIENAREILERGLRHFLGDSYVWLPEYEGVAEWLSDNKGKGLLCIGNCGRGKTVICQKIFPVLFENLIKRPYFVFDSNELGHKMDEIKSYVRYIMVDDIGLEQETVIYGERHNSFSELVDFAEKRGLLLVLTTNLTPDELSEKYGDRTRDRLRSLVKVVVFDGESMRK